MNVFGHTAPDGHGAWEIRAEDVKKDAFTPLQEEFQTLDSHEKTPWLRAQGAVYRTLPDDGAVSLVNLLSSFFFFFCFSFLPFFGIDTNLNTSLPSFAPAVLNMIMFGMNDVTEWMGFFCICLYFIMCETGCEAEKKEKIKKKRRKNKTTHLHQSFHIHYKISFNAPFSLV